MVAPFQGSALARGLRLPPPRGVLFHGPPGCSKTRLAQALARALGATFFALSGSEILSCYVGEAERRVRSLFAQARAATPAVVFFDELDALVAQRSSSSSSSGSSVLATLLTEMDGVVGWEGVLVVGATNRMAALDPALLRAGRLEYHCAVPLPDAAARADILAVHARGSLVGACPQQVRELLQRLARGTEGCSGAQLQDLTRRAALLALRQHVAGEGQAGAVGVTEQHYVQALQDLQH